MLQVVCADVLSATSDALIITLDGTLRVAPGRYERLLGNIGRQYLRRFPEAELLEELDAQLVLPMRLGAAAAIELERSPFPFLIAVSTLHHLETMSEPAKIAVVGEAFDNALSVAQSVGARTLATAVLQGGWRLSAETTATAMLQVLHARQSPRPRVTLCCAEAGLTERIRDLARSMALLSPAPGAE